MHPMSEGPEAMSGYAGAAKAPISVLLVVSCTTAWVISQLSYNALPQLLEPIKETFGQSDEVVGRLYGYELVVFALVALLAAVPLAFLSRVGIALAGGALAVAAGIVSSQTESYSVLVVCRVLLGMGGALVGASGTAAAASSANPERVYALVMVFSSVILAAEPALLEWLALGPHGLSGGLLALAIGTALLMPLLLWLLPPRPTDPVATASPWRQILDAPNRSIAVVAMFALFIYETGQGGIWTYIAELGERSGLEDQSFGNALSVVQLCGLVGSFLAIRIGDRFGSRWPIVIGISVNVGAAVGLGYSRNVALYMFLSVTWYAAYYFVVPYLLGLMARLDDLGRWAVALDAMWWLGDAAGPPIAGMIVERSGIELLAMFPLSTGVISISIFLRLLRHFSGPSASGETG
jgi:predicted MFS family arabinose efflux permease